MRLAAASVVAVLVSAGGMASATPFRVDFVTDTFGNESDPAGLLPPGWTASGGSGGVPTTFSGSWTYDDDAVDANPDPRVGEFFFSDPALTIELEAGGISYAFQLDRIAFVYSDAPGGVSLYEIMGSSTSSPIAGVTSEEIHIFFGTMSPLPSALIPAVDTPNPLAGSPWENGSGFSFLVVSGTSPSGSYSFSKVLGSHGEAQAVPEPAAALLFGGGLLAMALRRSIRGDLRSSA